MAYTLKDNDINKCEGKGVPVLSF